ncbi:MAG: TIGR00296 family protein [Conexivisphaerales archaeon]
MTSEDYSLEEGTYLVKAARHAVESLLKVPGQVPPSTASPRLREKRGAFVTIRLHPACELRGCIGRPYPSEALIDAVKESAVDAAVGDPRFEPVTPDELSGLTFEVSVLTEPVRLEVTSPKDYRKEVVIGRDGVIVRWRGGSGLLLPQVPVEEGWDIDTYLSYACMKAGATPDLWLSHEVGLSTFQAIVFEETAPCGPVRKLSLEPR